MRGGFPLNQALVFPSPAGGRGPGRGWARFTSPPPGGEAGSGGRFFWLQFVPAMRAPHRTAVLSTFTSNEWDSKQDKPRAFDLAGGHGVRARTTGHREPKRLSSLIENRPRHKRRAPAISGRGRKLGPWLNRWTGKNGGPLLFRWMKTTVHQAAHGGGLRAC